MGTFESFEEIDAWQEGRGLSRQIYSITSKKPFVKDFSLKDQIRRAGNSICLNIADYERSMTSSGEHKLTISGSPVRMGAFRSLARPTAKASA